MSPQPVRDGLLALVLGGMLGIGVAYARERSDDRVRSDRDVQRTVGRPVIGHIPYWKLAKRAAKKADRLAFLHDRSDAPAEAYRVLRRNVAFVTREPAGERGASVVVTSPLPGDGKTTVAGNLAVAAAEAGTQVLLVEADLRSPELAERFELGRVPGFSDLLSGEAGIPEVVADVDVPNLLLIPAGRLRSDRPQRFVSAEVARWMHTLEQIAELVVYDAPPLLAVADTLELAPAVSCTLLVTAVGRTPRRALRAATERLATVGTEVTGVVLNGLRSSGGYAAYYAPYCRVKASRDAPELVAEEAARVSGDGLGSPSGNGQPSRFTAERRPS